MNGKLLIPDKQLVKEMDIAAPRYTSYPTIPVWQTADKDDNYIRVLENHDPGRTLSLYFHIPFCPSVCHYCGCNTSKLDHDDQVADYLQALENELRLVGSLLGDKRRVSHIHWGGGSPTVLKEEQFSSIFSKIDSYFDVESKAEIAIETNPMTCLDEKLKFLLELGFNRFSIGIQDFNSNVQQHIGRHQTYERTEEFCGIIRRYGVRSLNFDLVYGLPAQTLEGLSDTLSKVEILSPDRIAVYSFAFLPAMRENQKNIDAALLPQAEEKFDLYLLTIDRLNRAGYRMIGIDHYAKPEDELVQACDQNRLRRNFMGYTTNSETDVLAFGATGISDIDGYYCQNLKDLKDYYGRVEKGHLPLQRQISLDQDDLIRRKVIMDLLCNGSVKKQEVEHQFNIDFDNYFELELPRLDGLIARGMVTCNDKMIEATELGRYFLRNIVLHFDNYLDGRKGPKNKTAFSRTV